jgi:hypothetical protein
MRSLGEFVGHIVRGFRTPAEGSQRRVVRTEVNEERRADGLILRRTTIEEVEVPGRGQRRESTEDQ